MKSSQLVAIIKRLEAMVEAQYRQRGSSSPFRKRRRRKMHSDLR